MTAFYDVFNGDADGLCALHQLRLYTPCASRLVTGAKRDLALLERIDPGHGDELTVLDLALGANAAALHRHLAHGAKCRYFDHHVCEDLPAHPNLELHIDTRADVCTSLIVDRYIAGQFRVWAVVAAFGDNLAAAARAHALPLTLPECQIQVLQELGECLNYNAYGDSVEDLNYHPADLYRTLSRYEDPFSFISDEPIFEVLRFSRSDDLYRAKEIVPELKTDECGLYVLPDAPWSRRVSGSFSNVLARTHPRRAHAVLTTCDNGYRVSVRSALEMPAGADTLCRQFEHGGGRRGAAGIELLPAHDYDRFVKAFKRAFGSHAD